MKVSDYNARLQLGKRGSEDERRMWDRERLLNEQTEVLMGLQGHWSWQ